MSRRRDNKKRGGSKRGKEAWIPAWKYGNGLHKVPTFDWWDYLCCKYNEPNHWKEKEPENQQQRRSKGFCGEIDNSQHK